MTEQEQHFFEKFDNPYKPSKNTLWRKVRSLGINTAMVFVGAGVIAGCCLSAIAQATKASVCQLFEKK